MARELATKLPSTGAVMPERTRGGVAYSPLVDILETDEELVIYADMPGLEPDHIDIRFDNGELTVHGRVDRPEPERDYLLHEYGVGDYVRTFVVYEDVDQEKIHAEYKNGVLMVHLPKAAEAKPKKIPVKAS